MLIFFGWLLCLSKVHGCRVASLMWSLGDGLILALVRGAQYVKKGPWRGMCFMNTVSKPANHTVGDLPYIYILYICNYIVNILYTITVYLPHVLYIHHWEIPTPKTSQPSPVDLPRTDSDERPDFLRLEHHRGLLPLGTFLVLWFLYVALFRSIAGNGVGFWLSRRPSGYTTCLTCYVGILTTNNPGYWDVVSNHYGYLGKLTGWIVYPLVNSHSYGELQFWFWSMIRR